ncbi:glycosyl transferase [Actinoplanes ianthinogenes]|uniref:polysaccharide deacetylase family protein n=1 Tax=Actinoplanes ianthinogenes TaxID=122358 RepID=UPI00166FE68A|nr:polysaccharide deacetylase family protein [Actinoplanes ianthinogenes]GGR51360.1 glycosyl transferase [Actinoplanes ianthinogenes]
MPEQINILFHGIGTPQRELEPGEDQYWISEAAFEAILDEVAGWPDVRLSFDDSNTSDVEIALPALLERGLTAEFFVLAGRLDLPGSLGADDLRTLIKNGMPVANHGMWHHPWRGMDDATTRAELAEARDRISSVIGRPVTRAACPLGRYDRKTLASLRRLGYTTVFTSDRRPATPGRWLQPRFSVYRDDTPESVRAAVERSRSLRPRLRNAAAGVVKRWR